MFVLIKNTEGGVESAKLQQIRLTKNGIAKVADKMSRNIKGLHNLTVKM